MADQDPKLSYDPTKLPTPRTPSDEYAIAILVEARATRIALTKMATLLERLAALAEQQVASKKTK